MADRLRSAVFFAPVASWWARTMVASIMKVSSSLSLLKSSNTFVHTPRWAHRLKRE
jgi:hypothetical protein